MLRADPEARTTVALGTVTGMFAAAHELVAGEGGDVRYGLEGRPLVSTVAPRLARRFAAGTPPVYLFGLAAHKDGIVLGDVWLGVVGEPLVPRHAV